MPLTDVFTRPVTESPLQQRFTQLMAAEPEIRRRDVAHKLEVSEAALIDQQCGVRSVRLNDQFADMIRAMPQLGYIMTLTRNEYAVHERKGIYDNVRIGGPMGLVITEDRKIDLRIVLSRWAFGYGVREETARGDRFSLQFFDNTGTAIQKIFLQPDSNEQGYAELVNNFRAAEQGGEQTYSDSVEVPEYAADDQVDVAKLTEEWLGMTDVHQFFGMLRRHQVSREQAFRLVGAPHAEPVDPAGIVTLLEEAAAKELSIMCFVGNRGNIQIHTGPVKTIKRMGPWLNVLDPEFNLHLLESGVANAWLIRKPTEDGIVTSVELYDHAGETIAQFFGQRQEGNPENTVWRELAESLPGQEIAA